MAGTPSTPARAYRRSALLGQGLGESDAAIDPALQGGGGAEAGLRDVHEPLHRLPGEVPGTGGGLIERVVVSVCTDAHHQLVADDADGHVAVHEEREAAEHLLLAQTGVLADAAAA